MKSLFDSGAVDGMLARIDRLSAQSQPLWGKMNVGQMMVHCTIPLRMALGEVTLTPTTGATSRFPVKHLIIYLLPTPKSVPTHPQMRDPVTAGWQTDRDD